MKTDTILALLVLMLAAVASEQDVPSYNQQQRSGYLAKRSRTLKKDKKADKKSTKSGSPKSSPKNSPQPRFQIPQWLRRPCEFIGEQFDAAIRCNFNILLGQGKLAYSVSFLNPICDRPNQATRICFTPGYSGTFGFVNNVTLESAVQFYDISVGGQNIGDVEIKFDFCLEPRPSRPPTMAPGSLPPASGPSPTNAPVTSPVTTPVASTPAPTKAPTLAPTFAPTATQQTPGNNELALVDESNEALIDFHSLFVRNDTDHGRHLQLPARPALCGCSVSAYLPFLFNLFAIDALFWDSVQCTCVPCSGGGISVGCFLFDIPLFDLLECPGEVITAITRIVGNGGQTRPRVPDFLYRLNFEGKKN